MEEAIGTSRACRVLGKSRATVYRQRHPAPAARGGRAPFRHPAELPGEERAYVLAVLDSPRFADESPGQVWAVLLDEGTYLCSEATMYRLLRERGQSGERRAQAAHPAKKKPELMADGPNQVWSWDITKLKGPARGVFYLYTLSSTYFRAKSSGGISGLRRPALSEDSSSAPSKKTAGSGLARSMQTGEPR